jgi:hypothetical protein
MKNRITLAQTQEEFDKQVDEFLTEYKFPTDEDHRRLVGQIIQGSPDDDDTLDLEVSAKTIRKIRAKMFAFYLIKPGRRPEPETTEEVSLEVPVDESKE